ncbi:MAG: sulfurtransferase-like selenium metabolism protein YedF [Acidobacteria bacterium]|nr:sulfurtransferase-like selenium metabolism protein YedF [Acidobacteriota bacterium]
MAVDSSMLLLIKSSVLGDGEPDLGEKLLRAFLTQLLESGSIPAKIICMNSGIFLTTEASPVEDLMHQFASEGSEILSCGTCLEYYKRADRLVVGKPTNMRDTVQALVNFEKILQP